MSIKPKESKSKGIQKHPHFWRSPRKPLTENEIYFPISTRRLGESIEGLNSFLAQSPGEL